jgi:hypothetical protein
VASLTQIREALATTIADGVDAEMSVYERVTDVVQVPAAVITPTSADWKVALSRGTDKWMFDVFILVGRSDTTNAQEELDGFLAGAGPNSVREVLYNNPTLGIEDVDAFPTGMSGYGGEFSTARIPHVGAIIKVTVHADGF